MERNEKKLMRFMGYHQENIWIMEVTKGEEREEDIDSLLREIIA